MFTLKKVQYLAGMSQETHCYTADLYLNGCKVAEVGNAGHGGCDDVRYVNGGARNCIDDALDKLNYTYLDDTAMGAEIRRRICKLVEFGDDGYCKTIPSTPMKSYARNIRTFWILSGCSTIWSQFAAAW